MENKIIENKIEDSAELEKQSSTSPGIPKVSVVIPVYNVEKYLARCIESVVNQTLKDIEIIIVNDGSTDDSLLIMKEYAGKDSRIKIIDKPNSGYGNSVNCGIDAASGDYISIIESDDFAAHDMMETLYDFSEKGTVDIIKGNFWDYYEKDGKVPEAVVNNERKTTLVLDKPFTVKENPEILWGHPSIWSAIYLRKFLSENNIRMMEAEGAGWVDNPFFHETLAKADSIMWTDKPVYYYRKTNESSSSNRQTDPEIPFIRMEDNLDIFEKISFHDPKIDKVIFARALMYMRGAKKECEYSDNFEIIDKQSQNLMRRLDRNVMSTEFCLEDQLDWITSASPLKTLINSFPKVLIYNWLPFDNPWGWGGGVTVYCKNLIAQILKTDPNITVYFLSSGFAYDAKTDKIFIRMINNTFGDRVRQFEIVNSPVPAEQRNIYRNPTVALENKELKNIVDDFISKFGPFHSIHFNNIEGLSLDIFELKEKLPDTKFIFSIHNYVPLCVNGSYYMRHKHCICSPDHTAEDCFKCTRADIWSNISDKMYYERGAYNQDPQKCISKSRWLKSFGLERLDYDASEEEILSFASTATEKINKYCDNILAVSKRVYDIAAANGFDTEKMVVQYIGTKVAEKQLGHGTAKENGGLKIVFLGSDINYEEKGYPFLLDALSQMEAKYAGKIDLVLTVKQAEHAEIYTMLKNFRSIKVIQGYTHGDLPLIFEGCHFSIVPVLWEDNLPQISIESVAYGVPVLSSDAGGASELCDSELFLFKSGSAEDMISKIVHFLENPDDLDEYWKHHHGLVTMKMHWDDLRRYYSLPETKTVEMSKEDFSYLLEEHDFLLNNIQTDHEGFAPDSVLRDLREKLWKAKDENEKLKLEIKEMEQFKGKVTFKTDYDPIQGNAGAKLFSLTLEDFNYSDFYAEIKFIKLENMGVSVSDTLQISGTWHGDEDSRVLTFHQMDWAKADKPLKDWICVYTEKNSVVFFAGYPGKACGYDYSILALTSRADRDSVKFEQLNQGFIWENELRPQGAIGDLSGAAAEMPAADKEVQTGKESIIGTFKNRIKRTIIKEE